MLSPSKLLEKIQGVTIQRYYAKKAKQIAQHGFGREGRNLFPTEDCQVIYTEGVRAINSRQYVKAIEELQPDVIALCGASILKEPLLGIPPRGVVNLHGGLAQKYRGLWTTLWAIYNEEPEFVGYTIHYVTPGIDDGDIICQGRPTIYKDDNHETLYVKVVKLGTEAMIKAIHDIQNETVRSCPLKQGGRLYLGSMVTPAIVKKTWRKIRAGVIRDYAKHPKDVKLIESGKTSLLNTS